MSGIFLQAAVCIWWAILGDLQGTDQYSHGESLLGSDQHSHGKYHRVWSVFTQPITGSDQCSRGESQGLVSTHTTNRTQDKCNQSSSLFPADIFMAIKFRYFSYFSSYFISIRCLNGGRLNKTITLPWYKS